PLASLVSFPTRFTGAARTAVSTLSLHDALPISKGRTGDAFHLCLASREKRAAHGLGKRHESKQAHHQGHDALVIVLLHQPADFRDRKSTRLNSSHVKISYAVFCLKKKNNQRCRS